MAIDRRTPRYANRKCRRLTHSLSERHSVGADGRDLRRIQMEEDRAIRLFVSGKITEDRLDLQRRFITERLERARAKLDDYWAREASGAEKRQLMETVLTWVSMAVRS